MSADWQDISTAPKDGRLIIVYRPLAAETGDPLIKITHMNRYPQKSPQGVKHYADCWCHPTHWLPLPPPPGSSEG